LSVENCEKDNPSNNEGQEDEEEEEEVLKQQQPSTVEDKDQEYIIHLENKISQAEIERQKAKEEADNNLNKLRYLMADFDNYRKRTERQIESKLNQGKAELILKFVPIVIAEIRKGYMISDKVLRPSLVEISKSIVKNTAIDSNRAKGD
jgi:molecular chaperone GrpE